MSQPSWSMADLRLSMGATLKIFLFTSSRPQSSGINMTSMSHSLIQSNISQFRISLTNSISSLHKYILHISSSMNHLSRFCFLQSAPLEHYPCVVKLLKIMDIWQIMKLRIFSNFNNIFNSADSLREYSFQGSSISSI